MKKAERYFYPAVFTYEKGKEIAVDFPDLKAATSGVDDKDAYLSARELLGLVLAGMEEDEADIPDPTMFICRQFAWLIKIVQLIVLSHYRLG